MNNTFSVTGLTCQHCVNAVREEVTALAGVQAVDVELVADGISSLTVEADRELTTVEIAAALDEAGEYTLA